METEIKAKPRVMTTIRLPREMYTELEDLKQRFGIPHNRMIQRGIQLAIQEFASECKTHDAFSEA